MAGPDVENIKQLTTCQVAGCARGRRRHIPTPCPPRRGSRTRVSFNLFRQPACLSIDVGLCFGVSKSLYQFTKIESTSKTRLTVEGKIVTALVMVVQWIGHQTYNLLAVACLTSTWGTASCSYPYVLVTKLFNLALVVGHLHSVAGSGNILA